MTKTGYASSFGIKTVVSTFTVKLIDPCEDSTIVPEFTTVNLYAMISPEIRTYVFTDFADEVSLELDDKADSYHGRILCSPRLYQLKELKVDS